MNSIVNYGHFGIIRVFTLVTLGCIALIAYIFIWMDKVFIEDSWQQIKGITKFGKIWLYAHLVVIVILATVSWIELL